MAGRARCAHNPVLRPLRCAASRPAEPVDLAAVRADVRKGGSMRAARPTTRAVFRALKASKRTCAKRPPAGEHQAPDRRRRGNPPDTPRRLHQEEQGDAEGRRRGDQRFADVRLRRPVRSATGFAGWPTSRLICAARRPTSIGSFGGAAANPAMVLAQMLAQAKDKGGKIKIPNFYDDVVSWLPKSGRSSRSCRSTRRGTARSSASRSCSAKAATPRSSASGCARPAT